MNFFITSGPDLDLYCLLRRHFSLFFLSGAIYVVQPMFLIEFFGEQNLPPVFGMLMLSYGVSGIIGAPIAGLVYFSLAHLDLFLIQVCFMALPNYFTYIEPTVKQTWTNTKTPGGRSLDLQAECDFFHLCPEM